MESFKSFYLAEAAMSPVLASNDQVRRVAALIPISDSDEAEEMLEAVYYEVIVPIAKERLDKFNRTIKKFLSKSKYRKISEKPEFLSQIKKLDGLESKTIKRGKKLTKIGDIVRGALLFRNDEEVQMFVDDFRRKNSSLISDYEYKQRGKDPDFGYYGSHHLDLMVDGLVIELQVMTKKLWSYKEAAHEIYTNLRDADRAADAFDERLSKMLFDLGNRPAYRRESYDMDMDIDSDEDMADDDDSEELDTMMLRQMYMDDSFGDQYESEDEGWEDINAAYSRCSSR